MAEEEATSVSPNLCDTAGAVGLAVKAEASEAVDWEAPERHGVGSNLLEGPVELRRTHQSELRDARLELAARIAAQSSFAGSSPGSKAAVAIYGNDEDDDDDDESRTMSRNAGTASGYLPRPSRLEQFSHSSQKTLDEASEDTKEKAKDILNSLEGTIAPNLLALLQKQAGTEPAPAALKKAPTTTWRPPAACGFANSERLF